MSDGIILIINKQLNKMLGIKTIILLQYTTTFENDDQFYLKHL